MAEGGTGMMGAATAVTAGSGGLALEVTAPAFAAGAVVAGGGVVLGTSGAASLISGKGWKQQGKVIKGKVVAGLTTN
jgi:hypothetical protein